MAAVMGARRKRYDEEGEDSHPMPDFRRFRLDDLDEWLLGRLNFRWGPRSEAEWRNRLAGFANSNEYFMVTNEEAVLIAMRLPHPMTRVPVVMEIVAFARETNERDGVYSLMKGSRGEWALRALYKQLREWGRAMNATRLYVGVCSDVVPSNLREIYGDSSYYLVGAPC